MVQAVGKTDVINALQTACGSQKEDTMTFWCVIKLQGDEQ